MSIATKYQQLISQGFLPVTVGGFELPVVSVPVGDGQGTFFSYAFQVGGGSTPITIYDHPSILRHFPSNRRRRRRSAGGLRHRTPTALRGLYASERLLARD